jgi:hypothetical protein
MFLGWPSTKENLLKLIEKSNVDNNQLDHTDQLIKSIKDNPRNVIGRRLSFKNNMIRCHSLLKVSETIDCVTSQ